MAVSSFIYQPPTKSLFAAYRPVYFRVAATATDGTPIPPVVYCDVYINAIFYKSLSKTQYVKLNPTNTEWEFDIQDACQEFLKKEIPPIGGSSLVANTTSVIPVFCKFRSSKVNSDGFIEPEAPEPVQATGSSDAVPGTGFLTNLFFVLNSTQQHEDHQWLESHIDSFKVRTWDASLFPLTHRPDRYRVCKNDSDYFPVFDRFNFFVISKLRLNYRYLGQTQLQAQTINVNPQNSANMIMVPNGPKNLQPLFPAINFSELEEYYIQLVSSTNTVIATGTKNLMSKICDDDKVRIHFINYLGTVDAINMKVLTIENESESETYEKPLRYPLDKSQHSINRFNIKSNTTYSGRCLDYDERDNGWISELFNSPAAWIEQRSIQGQPESYIPIVISDKRVGLQKEDDRFINEVAVEFRMSHNKILLR